MFIYKTVLYLHPQLRAISSVGSEHLVYTEGVGGSNPSLPTSITILMNFHQDFLFSKTEAFFVVFENKKDCISKAHNGCICSRGFDKGYLIPYVQVSIVKYLSSIDFFCLSEACFVIFENKKSCMSKAHKGCICSRGFDKGYLIPYVQISIIKYLSSIDFFCLSEAYFVIFWKQKRDLV